MSDDTPDWKAVSVSLAADNARMCGIILAADALVEAADKYARTGQRADLIRAVDAYRITRQGQ